MPRWGVYDPEDAIAAWETLPELDSLAVMLDKHGLPTEAVDQRRQELASTPVKVRCYICRRRLITAPRLATDKPLRCGHCTKEACDLLYCFATGTVAITIGHTTLLRCEGHALMLWEHLRVNTPSVRPVWIRHLQKEAA